MALKLAEEQARREEKELEQELNNNPMKLLENRTEQSRNEIELLESLEELKDLRTRQENLDYDALLHQYDPTETVEQREERLAKLDDEYVKTVKFNGNVNKSKRVVTEEIIEIAKEEEATHLKKQKTEDFAQKIPKSVIKKPLVLVKKKEHIATTLSEVQKHQNSIQPSGSGLSLLSAYSDSDSNED